MSAGLAHEERTDIAIVGGGPAGAAAAIRLARAGREVVLLERAPHYRWRACGVFSSPATLGELRSLGFGDADLSRVARPIPRLWVAAPGGSEFALDYGRRDFPGPTAIGFDRSALDPLLLERAAAAGADVRPGVAVTEVALNGAGGRLVLAGSGGVSTLSARFVIGADGIRSTVARAAGVVRSARLPPRVGLTYHVAEAAAGDGQAGAEGVDGRMIVVRGGYCGLAPVPGGRVNVGIVLWGRHRRERLARLGAATTTDRIVDRLPDWVTDHGPRLETRRLDPVAGASPIAHRVSRRAGPGWLLIGDAAGFLDPFTGEGLHRALVSARLAATAVGAAPRRRTDAAAAAATYEQAMSAQFAAKDVVSWIVQLFVARPALFDHAAARLARRADLRERMGLVMGDLVPARDAFDPRFLAALLAP